MIVPTLAAAAMFALGASPSTDLRISDMRERLLAESSYIKRIGLNPQDYVFRLDFLTTRVRAVDSFAEPDVRGDLDAQVNLELKLDSELLVNLCPVFAAVEGLDESFYNDVPGITPDPVAFYVPPAPAPDGKYSLVMVLHGRTQTETDVVSRAMFRRLADRYHAILVAPWGSGSVLWGDEAAAEAYNVLLDVERAFPIDRRHVFLAGMSLGGAGVFHVAAAHPGAFVGLLAINGGLLHEDAMSAVHTLRDRNVYLVNSGKDPVITPAIAEGVYATLAAACVPVSQYLAPSASNDIYQSGVQIEAAWNDMFAGTVRNSNSRECSPVF